jgi:hypothetical protein
MPYLVSYLNLSPRTDYVLRKLTILGSIVNMGWGGGTWPFNGSNTFFTLKKIIAATWEINHFHRFSLQCHHIHASKRSPNSDIQVENHGKQQKLNTSDTFTLEQRNSHLHGSGMRDQCFGI